MQCVCPCFSLFRDCHKSKCIDNLSHFKEYTSSIFGDPIDFVQYVQANYDYFYHRIVMRITKLILVFTLRNLLPVRMKVEIYLFMRFIREMLLHHLITIPVLTIPDSI